MLEKARENAAIFSLLISGLALIVSARSCSEAQAGRALSEAVNRADVLPTELSLRMVGQQDGTVQYAISHTVKNMGKASATEVVDHLQYRVGVGRPRLAHEPTVFNVLQPGDQSSALNPVSFTSDELQLLHERRQRFEVQLSLEFRDTLTGKTFAAQYCYAHIGGGFDALVSNGNHISIAGMFPCDSEYVKHNAK
jgi:hypothetical protein